MLVKVGATSRRAWIRMSNMRNIAMTLSKKLVIAALALPCSVAAISAYSAAEQNNAAEFAKAKINIFQAIHAAEKHHPGRAMSAEFEMRDGKPVYKVDVLTKQKKTMEVVVDAKDGKVVSAMATNGAGASEQQKN
jgi:uncharacterized membrane protein YkoI